MMSKFFVLENEQISVKVLAKGAELKSVYHKQNHTEYMWQADPTFWAKTSPILFPIVGALKQNTFHYQNHTYTLPRHGFARDMEFELIEQTNTCLVLALTSNADTVKNYPFNFTFYVEYQLHLQGVEVKYRVKHNGEGDMFFSIGAHPAFNVPMFEHESFEDYQLEFNATEHVEQLSLNKDGLITQETKPFLQQANSLPLNHDLFKQDAIVTKNLQSTCISIMHKSKHHGIKVHYQQFPFMGLWQPYGAPFLCIEPWCGIADDEFTNQELSTKKGIEIISSNQTFERSWRIEIVP